MLQITIPARELWDDAKGEFSYTKERTLQLEHSLVSLSKWEMKWAKPFFTKEEKTYEETIDYIRCMTITQNVPSEAYTLLTNENIAEINEYIAAPMTATVFSDNKKGSGSNEFVTNELIYYWMNALQIPIECQKWHINRLLTLIRVTNTKNNPQKKMSQRETTEYYARLNEERRKKYNSKG